MSGFADLAADVKATAERLDAEVEDGLDDGAEDTKDAAKARLRQNDNIAHGNLVHNVRVHDGIGLSLDADVARVIRSEADHSPFIEWGTGLFNTGDSPFTIFDAPDPRPPIGAIRQWIIRKGITPRYIPGDRGVTVSKDHIANQHRLAVAIANSIGAVGNRGYPFMRPAYRATKPTIVGNVADGIRDAAQW